MADLTIGDMATFKAGDVVTIDMPEIDPATRAFTGRRVPRVFDVVTVAGQLVLRPRPQEQPEESA